MSERIHLDRGRFPERDEAQHDLHGESDESHPNFMHVRCISTKIHTEVSNDLTCDKITSRVILEKLDKNCLSKELLTSSTGKSVPGIQYYALSTQRFQKQRLRVQHGRPVARMNSKRFYICKSL